MIRTRCVAIALLATGIFVSVVAAGDGEPVSAFAPGVGVKHGGEPAPSVTVYEVPDGRTFLLTDVLVANQGEERGPLYLADSDGVRCSIELMQTTVINDVAGTFRTLGNPHLTFSTGIPFQAGEPVLATLVGGTRGIDVTITGRLVPGRRVRASVRLPGGARAPEREPAPADEAR